MRFHLLSVPNTVLTADFPLDGFCHRTRMFAALLKRLGHEVFLYGVEGSDTPCDQFFACLTRAEYDGFVGATPYQHVPFDPSTPLFITFNTRAAQTIRSMKQSGDVIATIAGAAQAFIAEHHPELRFLEFSIGYRGICAPYRVYESHAWRHVVHGYTGVDGGRDFDTVIPPWWDPEDFTATTSPESYVLYCGRIVASKGIRTACQAAERAGVRLVLAGHGDPALITYGDFVGAVGPIERNALLSKARAVLMPTQYLEPFGNVSAEAQLSGTPVISTDHGAFVETVEHGTSGYRCNTLGEFVQAIDLAQDLDREQIAVRARKLWSTDTAMLSYAAYFRRLDLVGKDGWGDLSPGLTMRTDYEFAR